MHVETDRPAFPGSGMMGIESGRRDAMDITGLEGIGVKTGATQFHAWVTNHFKYATYSSRCLA